MMTHEVLQDEGFGGDSKIRNGRLFVYELIIQRDCKEGEYKFMTWSLFFLPVLQLSCIDILMNYTLFHCTSTELTLD